MIEKAATIRKKRTAGKAAKARADRLFSQYVRLRDKQCTVCGTTQNLQCAHVVSRRFSATRCVPDNAHTLCAGHHMEFTEDPHAHVMWAYRMIGEERYAELRTQAYEGAKGIDWKLIGDEIATWIRRLDG